MDFEVFNWLRLVELPPTHMTIVVHVQLSSFGTTAVFVFVIYRPARKEGTTGRVLCDGAVDLLRTVAPLRASYIDTYPDIWVQHHFHCQVEHVLGKIWHHRSPASVISSIVISTRAILDPH